MRSVAGRCTVFMSTPGGEGEGSGAVPQVVRRRLRGGSCTWPARLAPRDRRGGDGRTGCGRRRARVGGVAGRVRIDPGGGRRSYA